ncbi:TIGR04423 family type III CRISPR-associated protein [Prevotella falsenii]|uniref:TIGR04423 family type III CRISPR-associated protein n=1 Tax=Prevotella falsenii TaxID=515414 RepID=UPI00055C95F4|nr:TIGR04423 family type III CRISPR-associated protein [Prevotella falsenii]
MNTTQNIDFNLRYEGYLWLSDEHHPRTFCPAKLVERELLCGNNPFVVEGYLYNKEKGLSFSIKNIDGKCHIYKNEVKPEDIESDNPTIDRVSYLTLCRNNDHARRACFLRYWIPQPDPACLEMNVLEVEKEVFIGFKE